MAKEQFRKGLNDFLKNNHHVTNIGDLTNQTLSIGFGYFYILEVLSKLNPGIFPSDIDELEQCVCDGSNDQGVDMIFSYETCHYFIQLKYQGRDKSKRAESDMEVAHFLNIAERLHPSAGEKHKKNARLTDLLANISWREDTFKFLYLTLGKRTDDITTLERAQVRDSSLHPDLRDFSSRAEFTFLDETDLNKQYRDALKGETIVEAELFLSDDSNGIGWYRHKNDDGKISYISTLSAAQLGHIYTTHRDSLFNLNIRNWVGNTVTNKDIEKTVSEDSDNFFFFNNGISAIASEIEEDQKNNKLLCREFSIINGAQTVKSIARKHQELVGKQRADSIKSLRVMIRITKVDNVNTRSNFVDHITQYNNSQNAVKPSDFRSNDGVQTSLNKHFKQISYNGKKYHYKNKRQKGGEPKNSIVIALDNFCKAVYTFWYGPVDMQGGISHLYDTKPLKGGYAKLFGDQDGEIHDVLHKDDLDVFASVYFICESSQSSMARYLKSKEQMFQTDEEKYLKWKRALQGKFMICYVVSQLLLVLARDKYKELGVIGDNRKALTIALKKNKYNQPQNWRKKTDLFESFEALVEVGCEILFGVYTAAYNSPNFVHRNFVRDPKMLDSIADQIESRLSSLKQASGNLI